MGQASDYLFTPLPLSQSSDTDMPNKECQTGHDSLPSEQSQAAHPTSPSSRAAESQDVPNNEYPGSFILRGLGEFLYSVLLLGALDAKERYLAASSQTNGDDDDIDTVSQCSDGTGIGGDESSEVSASMAAIAMEVESDSTIPSELEDSSLRGAYEVVSVIYSDSDENICPSLDGNPFLHDAAGDSESKIDADGRITEVLPVSLAMSADTPSPRTGYPDLTATPTPSGNTHGSEIRSTAQPLFHSFARPSIYPTETSIEQVTSVNYDDLQTPTNDTSQGGGSPSSQLPYGMSDSETENEETESIHKPKGFRLMKSARKFLKGQYYRNKSPVTARTREFPKLMNTEDPPIQAVAARKPMIVQSPVRQHSFQPMMFDATESGDYDGEGDEEDEFLPPFNRL